MGLFKRRKKKETEEMPGRAKGSAGEEISGDGISSDAAQEARAEEAPAENAAAEAGPAKAVTPEDADTDIKPDAEAEGKSAAAEGQSRVPKKLTPEEAARRRETGLLLTYHIQHYTEAKSRPALKNVLNVLKDAWLWVPVRFALSKADIERMKALPKGTKFRPKDPVKVQTGVLKSKDGKLIFPAFADKEEIPEAYQKKNAWVQMPARQCMAETLKNGKLAAFTIDAFTTPFVLNRDSLAKLLGAAPMAEPAPQETAEGGTATGAKEPHTDAKEPDGGAEEEA